MTGYKMFMQGILAAAMVAFIAHGGASMAADLGVPATDEGLPGTGPIRRADWFKKHWQGRREGWEARRDTDRHALVFAGDSITEGWGDGFHGAFPGVKLANRGISGDKIGRAHV